MHLYTHDSQSSSSSSTHALTLSSVCFWDLKSPASNKPFRGNVILRCVTERNGNPVSLALLVSYIFTPQVRVEVAITAILGGSYILKHLEESMATNRLWLISSQKTNGDGFPSFKEKL